MPETSTHFHQRQHQIKFTLAELAEIVGVPAEALGVTHVDTAPGDSDAVVRICLNENCDTSQGSLFQT